MNFSRIFLGIAALANAVVAQSIDPTTRQPGVPLVLVPSEPLTELRLPKPHTETANAPASTGTAKSEQRVRPAILDLKPAGDPIYLVEEPDLDAHQWRTYRRPKVEQFSRDGEGIAVQGYDVLSYFGGRAEKGKKEFSVANGGTVWLFTTADNRDLFTRDPERYLPAYGGFCAYSVGKGYPATADARVFITDGARLYLFFDEAVRAVWEQDRRRLVGKADHNWPKLHR